MSYRKICTPCPREVVARGGQWAPPWIDRVYDRKSVPGFLSFESSESAST